MFDFIDISDLLHNKRVQVSLAKGIKKEHFSSFGILRNSDQNMHFWGKKSHSQQYHL